MKKEEKEAYIKALVEATIKRIETARKNKNAAKLADLTRQGIKTTGQIKYILDILRDTKYREMPLLEFLKEYTETVADIFECMAKILARPEFINK